MSEASPGSSGAVPDIDPSQFASMVGQADDAALEQGFAANRELILDEIFRRMPEEFDTQKAGDLEAVVEWRILDAPGGGIDRYQLVIRKGSCRLEKEGNEQPTVAFELKPVDFIKLVTGNAGGPQLFMFGKLRIDGDLMLAARLQGFFRIPDAGGTTPQAPPG
jgi:putative sterol carrier protein